MQQIMKITDLKYALLLSILFCATLFTGCSDDDAAAPDLTGKGEVTFKFERNTIYSISTLEEMARLKVTLEKDGKEVVLETVNLAGDETQLTSDVIALEEGTYLVKKYIAYNKKGAQVQEAYLEADNTLVIKNGEPAVFSFPVSIRFVYVNNQLRNQLFGLCAEVLGEDSAAWPKTWRVENEDMLEWENLEYETDDDGNILYLSGIVFDEKTFPGMKKMPAVISTFVTLENITVRDIPEFEELPDNLNESSMTDILIKNTGFKAFPKNIEKMKKLTSLSIIDSKLTEVPVSLGELESLEMVDICGNEVTEFPAGLAKKWQKLRSLRMTDTKLATLPEDFFSMEKVTTYDLRNNPSLTSLPEMRVEGIHLGTILLDGCGLTALPKIATNGLITALSLADNKITSVSDADVNALSKKLRTLILSGNQIGTFPKMTSDGMQELDLSNCGLSAIPDLSGMPNLHILRAAKNNITEVKAGTFSGNEKFAILDLADNAQLMKFAEEPGFKKVEQTTDGLSKLGEVAVDVLFDPTSQTSQNDTPTRDKTPVGKPAYLKAVNVTNCPQLEWEIPGTWCHIRGGVVENKEEYAIPPRSVVVYKDGSPNVTREDCKYAACFYAQGKLSYDNHFDFDEWLESVKNKQD